jgi:hypothetical protein
MSLRPDETPEPSGPPCSVCQGGYFRDCWGYPLCEPCSVSWANSPECKAVQSDAPESPAPLRREAYQRAVKVWCAARKAAVAA